MAWGPRARAVLFKLRQHINWGDASNATTNEAYHGFFPRAPLRPRGRAKTGLTRDRYYLSHNDARVRVDITVTSTLFEGFATKYSPGYLLEPRWAWCEGARGAGIGTKIRYTFGAAISLRALAVAPGWSHYPRQWRANNRIGRLAIRTSTGLRKRVTFANQRKTFRVKLYDESTRVKWLAFEILAVHRGRSRATNDTCVGMIRPVDPSLRGE